MARPALVIALIALLAASQAPLRAAATTQQEADALSTSLSSFLDSLRGWAAILRFAAQHPKTVAELAQQAPRNMSILINAIPRADLQTITGDPNFKATILAPTNAAFRDALFKLKLTPVQLYADKTALTNILNYHVIPGQALKVGDLQDGKEVETVSKHKLQVSVDKVAGTLFKGESETAKVIAGDLLAGQSVIHIVDTVLLPPVQPSKKEQK